MERGLEYFNDLMTDIDVCAFQLGALLSRYLAESLDVSDGGISGLDIEVPVFLKGNCREIKINRIRYSGDREAVILSGENDDLIWDSLSLTAQQRVIDALHVAMVSRRTMSRPLNDLEIH